MRAVVFLNPASGPDDEGQPDEVASLFAAAGVQAAVRTVEGAALPDAVRAAVADGAEVIVVGGGDGSLSAAAGVLAGTQTPLGVLPLGTFNHFARGLGIPEALEEAVQVVAAQRISVLDVGTVNGTVFINNAALGLAPEVVVLRERNGNGRGRFGRALATLAVALRVLFHPPRLHVQVHTETGAVRCTTPFVFVTPNEYAPNLFHFAVEARRTDGRLNLYLATTARPFYLLRLAWHVVTGHVDRHLEVSTPATVQLTLRTPAVRVLMDGEVRTLATPIVIEGQRGALRVIVPAQTRETT